MIDNQSTDRSYREEKSEQNEPWNVKEEVNNKTERGLVPH